MESLFISPIGRESKVLRGLNQEVRKPDIPTPSLPIQTSADVFICYIRRGRSIRSYIPRRGLRGWRNPCPRLNYKIRFGKPGTWHINAHTEAGIARGGQR